MRAKVLHKLYISTMVLTAVSVTAYLAYVGYSYYILPIEERFYHPRHDWFKPSGLVGHGLGFLGTFMILFGVVIYILRKRKRFLSKYIRLKYLLEFHIFLCILGPILIVFHTSFKFGGIVSIAFWSMVAVVLSGFIGRFIYIQIPRTIEGRALSLLELGTMRRDLTTELHLKTNIDNETLQLISSVTESNKEAVKRSYFGKIWHNRKAIQAINQSLRRTDRSRAERLMIVRLIKREMALAHKIERLNTMQKLFRYWHVAHLPFALIMLIIVLIHIAVTLAFGYKWIF